MAKTITLQVSVSVPDDMTVQDLVTGIEQYGAVRLLAQPQVRLNLSDAEAIEKCEQAGVCFILEQEGMATGMWSWRSGDGERIGKLCDNKIEAAWDALDELGLNGRLDPQPAWPEDKLAIEVCDACDVRLVEAQKGETKGMGEWLDEFAIELCEKSDVRLVEAQEDEIKGMWGWIDNQGNASEVSLPTKGEAARNAVNTLELHF